MALKRGRVMRKIVAMAAVVLSLASARSYGQFPAAPGTGPGLAETIEAIDSARVTTRILYVTAHPDDERADVLTYLARGLHADVALLSLTRGEGGQNALGPEQAPQLGLIRTQELLAATRGYGVKLYFTRAKDFGFSKTPEETEKIWGDQVLEDMVRVIRTFRPNIVINNWGGVHGGHGHHQAAGLLTPIAVQRAADANAYPEHLKEGLPAWGSANNEVVILDLDRSDKPTGYVLPLDEVSPLWGKSWREIGLDAFGNHRTQGIAAFLGSPFFRRPLALKREDGKDLDPASLARPLAALTSNHGLVACAGSKEYLQSLASKFDAKLDEAKQAALGLSWAKAAKAIAQAAELLDPPLARNSVPPGCNVGDLRELVWVEERIDHALEFAARVQITSNVNRQFVAVGETAEVSSARRCRTAELCVFDSNGLVLPDGTTQQDKNGGIDNELHTLRATRLASDRTSIGVPVGSPAFAVNQTLSVGDHRFSMESPVLFVAANTTHAEQVPPQVVPAYTLAVEPKQEIEKLTAKHESFDVFLRVHSYSQKAATVSVGLDVPAGWKSSGAVDVSFTGEGDRYAKLTVTPPTKMEAGRYTITAYAKRGEEKFTTSIEPLVSMPTLTWEEPAQTVVHAFDIKVPENLRVGYISAESEPVPDALKMLGIHVEMLDANALNFGDLSKYDAIVVGVRAYELRGELPGANQRLLDYAQNGGTLVVQYQRDFAWDGKNYAPYPAKIANKAGEPLPRITDETSPVKFLKPDDALLNTPNKITQDDFKGWVQERGLYFWSEYDSRYTPLLAMNDPGEKDLDGALLYTKLGKGTYIYTGIAFFRQLPEGVPGAYRLFVNLLAASRRK
ncbi:MAG TPA: PIG-L family deacetylase [Candidatus Acidoferrum sp.]|nr:PIG-L family deacetylase [Candidatus Acidoferrum sp.]